MALIKHSNSRDIARDAVVLDLGDLQRQAALITRAAHDQAAAVLAEARAERERIVAGAAEAGRAAGFEEGHAAGLKAGAEEGRAAAITANAERLDRLETAWSSALDGFESARQDLLNAANRDVLRLALGIAERVVKRAVRTEPGIVADQLAAVLAVVVRPTELLVRVHPGDLPFATQALPKLLPRFAMVRHVELAEDATLDPGSCIAAVRGSENGPGVGGGLGGGEIDASIATQMDRIVEALLPGRGEAPDANADPHA